MLQTLLLLLILIILVCISIAGVLFSYKYAKIIESSIAKIENTLKRLTLQNPNAKSSAEEVTIL